MSRLNRSNIATFFLIAGTQLAFSFSVSAQALSANAGGNQTICPDDTTLLGGSPAATGGAPPYTYSWQPTTELISPSSENPYAFPSGTASYTLTVTDSLGNSSTDVVSISHFSLPIVDAGPDQTIIAGTNTMLHGSGAVTYYWEDPYGNITNQGSANPTAEPGGTATYSVVGIDANGCANYDSVTVVVIPSDSVIIYNAFTPNADGDNDFLFIGNLWKYPDNKIEIFNRNGKIVYQESHYQNDWDGKIEGAELPCATYYVAISLGGGNGKANGAVTIIR